MSHGKGDIISAIKEHIDIPDYLESCGYHVRKHGSKGKLTLKEHDSFVYDPERKRFYWNSRDLEGDIVDLYGYLNNCDFDAALRALRAMLPARTYQASRPPHRQFSVRVSPNRLLFHRPNLLHKI